MEKIKTIFKSSKDFTEEHSNLNDVVEFLKNVDNEFCSVAFEGASMALALNDLQLENDLENWKFFITNFGKNHEAQIYVGLGWALAQEGKSALFFNDKLDPMMRYRVMDGYGYFESIFRQRRTIKNQQLPDDLSGIALKSYNQGVGRSLWYYSIGDPNHAVEMINNFDVSKHPDLWRGVGIASAYVGGLEENKIQELFSLASSNQPQLAAGAALAAKSKSIAKCITPDIEAMCQQWCNLSVNEIVDMTENLLPVSSDNAYEQWISAIEKQFTTSDITN